MLAGSSAPKALDLASFRLLDILGVTLGEVRSGKLGEILGFGGIDITALSEAELARWRAANVGFIFQFYNLIPSLTARENVALVTDIVPDSLARTRSALQRAFAEYGLDERLVFVGSGRLGFPDAALVAFALPAMVGLGAQSPSPTTRRARRTAFTVVEASIPAMRDAMARVGADPRKVNPLRTTDIVIDHAIVAEYAGTLVMGAKTPKPLKIDLKDQTGVAAMIADYHLNEDGIRVASLRASSDKSVRR